MGYCGGYGLAGLRCREVPLRGRISLARVWPGVLALLCVGLFFFFFQAEDGIRDRDVTGVQTCALPICALGFELYPHRFEFTHSLPEVLARYSTRTAQELTSENPRVRVAGRVMTIRPQDRKSVV